jgi:hypothetical protein
MADLKLIIAATAAFPTIEWSHIDCSMGETLVISHLMPMKSAAGWYLGRACVEVDDPHSPNHINVDFGYGPYSRETGYYPDEATLRKVHEADMLPVRDCVENNALYDSGRLPKP